ncbi:MAG TPA: molybdopterin-synthase adenylyltransferase MoeB [Anaeromyxobacteraceae bacterium]|nr:molybdopterin-synthase adenylyltransferase MoeB [Anaeromyxobacteraceae bacterium]
MTRSGPPLEPAELRRYSRHLLLPEVGEAGQRRLKGTRLLLVGAGGLGSPAALYLAAAGVGRITVVDPDRVDVTNLQRQVLFGTRDVGRSKAEAARDRIRDLNPHVEVDALPARLDAGNALDLVRAHDLVVDGTDSFATRYVVNDACVLAGRPNVHASIYRFEGQATVLSAPGGPCYRCIYPSPPGPGEVPSCADAGVLGVLPGILGAIQAAEAVRLALGVGEPLVGRLLLVDALGMDFRVLRVSRDPRCPACGTGEIREVREEAAACAPALAVPEIEPLELARLLASAGPPLLVDVREPHEWRESRIPGAVLAPLSRLDAEVPALDRSRDVVLYCRSGVRSQDAGARLRAAGFDRVRSLAGGILRWADEVGPFRPGS